MTARIIASRASMSLPSFTARGRAQAASRIASSASSSVIRYEFFEVKDSIAWTSVSMPVIAVRNGGRPVVSSGSSSANIAVAFGLMITSFLCWSGSAMTELIVISAPVPAVVGIATTGAAIFGTLSSPM